MLKILKRGTLLTVGPIVQDFPIAHISPDFLASTSFPRNYLPSQPSELTCISDALLSPDFLGLKGDMLGSGFWVRLGLQPLTSTICETQPPASIGWVALAILNVRSFVVCPAWGTSPLISTIWCFRPYKPYIFCEDMILATYPEFIAELSPVYWCLFGLPSSHSFYKDLKTPLPTQKDLFWSYDSHESLDCTHNSRVYIF